MQLLFMLYVGAIPLIPLLGANYFKRIGRKNMRMACLLLFACQTLLSGLAIYYRIFA